MKITEDVRKYACRAKGLAEEKRSRPAMAEKATELQRKRR